MTITKTKRSGEAILLQIINFDELFFSLLEIVADWTLERAERKWHFPRTPVISIDAWSRLIFRHWEPWTGSRFSSGSSSPYPHGLINIYFWPIAHFLLNWSSTWGCCFYKVHCFCLVGLLHLWFRYVVQYCTHSVWHWIVDSLILHFHTLMN